MCSHFRLASADTATRGLLKGRVHLAVVTTAARAVGGGHEVRPTDPVLAVRAGRGGARLGAYRWGLIPAWARDPTALRATFNARSETVAEKSCFRDAWRRGQRCLVFAAACYEWSPGPTPRAPKVTHALIPAAAGAGGFAMAGLWDAWTDPATGAAAGSCTVLTTVPNRVWAAVHHRMPVVLAPGDFARWLDPQLPPDAAHALCVPCATDVLRAAPVASAAAAA